jgi:hypothetical protein
VVRCRALTAPAHVPSTASHWISTWSVAREQLVAALGASARPAYTTLRTAEGMLPKLLPRITTRVPPRVSKQAPRSADTCRHNRGHRKLPHCGSPHSAMITHHARTTIRRPLHRTSPPPPPRYPPFNPQFVNRPRQHAPPSLPPPLQACPSPLFPIPHTPTPAPCPHKRTSPTSCTTGGA